MQGVVLYSCRQVGELARLLGREQEAQALVALREKMQRAALAYLWDPEQQLFISGVAKQISWASQIWLVLAQVMDNAANQQILQRVMAHDAAVKPLTPYLYHHMVSALIACGNAQEAKQVVLGYWGAMVQGGADTFWEAFEPGNPMASPYGSKLINSYCHAWSCTPAYFIRHHFSKS